MADDISTVRRELRQVEAKVGRSLSSIEGRLDDINKQKLMNPLDTIADKLL